MTFEHSTFAGYGWPAPRAVAVNVTTTLTLAVAVAAFCRDTPHTLLHPFATFHPTVLLVWLVDYRTLPDARLLPRLPLFTDRVYIRAQTLRVMTFIDQLHYYTWLYITIGLPFSGLHHATFISRTGPHFATHGPLVPYLHCDFLCRTVTSLPLAFYATQPSPCHTQLSACPAPTPIT